MPSDITGTEIIEDQPGVGTNRSGRPRPVFANIVLADEITALLQNTRRPSEAMQEHRSLLQNTYTLAEPFFVLPRKTHRQEGTYPCLKPARQVHVQSLAGLPLAEEEVQIVKSTTSLHCTEPRHVLTGSQTRRSDLVRRVPRSDNVSSTRSVWFVQAVRGPHRRRIRLRTGSGGGAGDVAVSDSGAKSRHC